MGPREDGLRTELGFRGQSLQQRPEKARRTLAEQSGAWVGSASGVSWEVPIVSEGKQSESLRKLASGQVLKR